MATSFRLDIRSMQQEIYTGMAQKLFATGIIGQLEILAGHTFLMTELLPGPVWVMGEDGQEEVYYISGGYLIVEPHDITTVLADTVIRAKDVDYEAALAAKRRAEEAMDEHGRDFNYAKAHAQLMEAIAQLRTFKKLRDRSK